MTAQTPQQPASATETGLGIEQGPNRYADTPEAPKGPQIGDSDAGAIGRLTEAQREDLRQVMAVDWCDPCAQGTTDVDGCHCSALFEAGVERVAAIVREHVTAALAEVESLAHYWERTPALRRGTAAAELRRALHRAHDLREGVGR